MTDQTTPEFAEVEELKPMQKIAALLDQLDHVELYALRNLIMHLEMKLERDEKAKLDAYRK
jgi:hypothetical protein